ncbi:MAG: DUF1566 domain-containing protein [Elusimicrobiota bacterium]
MKQFKIEDLTLNQVQGKILLFAIFSLLFTLHPLRLTAGNLDSPSAPAATGVTLTDIRNRISSGTAAGTHSLQPSASPASTGYTLQQIYDAVPASTTTATAGDVLSNRTFIQRAAGVMSYSTGTLPTQTLSAANETVSAGYYAATTLSAVDADLAVGNIKTGVNIFGKAGTLTSGAVPDTDQTTSYTATVGEDHDYQPAATQMNYTLNGTTTTTDNRTGLEWAQNGTGAGCNSGTAITWEQALTFCEGLNFAGRTDWRLPNAKELFSIVRFEGAAPFINQTAFPNTVSNYYWTSTTYVPTTAYAMIVNFSNGNVTNDGKTTLYYVRPVRGGP